MKKYIVVFLSLFFFSGVGKENDVQPCYKADVIFIVDYSGSVDHIIPTYEPWLRDILYGLPLSENLKAGLIFFSDSVCEYNCPLTEDKFLFDQCIISAHNCPSAGTKMVPALVMSQLFFAKSVEERGEKVPQIIVMITDSAVSDDIESCEMIQSEMSEVFFIVINLDKECSSSVLHMIDCMLVNGISFNGFLNVYEDLLKQFDPCS